MVKINSRLLAELKKQTQDVCEEDLIELAASNLDPIEPSKKVKSITVIGKNTFRVYADSVLTHSLELDEIETFKLISGVGCVFLEYIKKESGEHVLFARADSRYQASLGKFVKRVNHYLRYHDTDFSRIGSVTETACPKCGKPYPKGSHTCPRCVSKKKTLKRLLSLIRGEWRIVAISMLFFFATTALGVLLPYVNRIMVDDYIQNDSENILLIGFLGVILSILAIHLFQRLFNVCRRLCLVVAGDRLVRRLRDMVFCKIQELSLPKISRRTSGELLRRVNQDTVTIKQFLVNQLPTVLEQGLLLLAIALVMFLYDPLLAILIILPAPFVTLSFRLFWSFLSNLYRQYWDLNSRSGAVLHDIFSGIRVVKSYGMEEHEEGRYVNVSSRERDSQMRAERFWALVNPWLNFVLGVGEFILLYYVGNKMLGGEMSAGEMSQFSAYAGMIYGPLSALMGFPRQLMTMMTSLTRVYEVMDETVDVKSEKEISLPDLKGYIDINGIAFGYDDSDTVLHDVDLHIKPGEFIGLVGKSGVGKSTLINLIMRMYDVDEGSIQIDGVDIRELSQETLRSRMGVVLQETFLFAGSIWQNLTYAKPDATREQVVQAAKMAGAHEFILRLPEGYNTYVGEKGHKLSGGERQRIAIARALLHDPKILILDEATSALDTETEKLIQDALQALSAGRTTIAIAHRLSTLRNATRLVVLDKGTVAEVGSHEELMQKEGIYYGLVMAQRQMTKMDTE